MNVKKDPKTGKWEAQFYFTDWKGKSTKKHKRGFATKKEAIAYLMRQSSCGHIGKNVLL